MTSGQKTLELTLPKSLVDHLCLDQTAPLFVGKGQTIIAEHKPVNALFLIVQGWATARLSIGTGNTQILGVLGAGSLAGLPLFGQSSSDNYSVAALQDSYMYKLNADEIKRAASEDEDVWLWLSRSLTREARCLQHQVTALGQHPARGRLAFALLQFLAVAQQQGETAVGQTINLPMTQEDIGNMTGLTNVSISKLMVAFRQEGLIDYGRGRFIIRDVAGLESLCGMSL
jgi:CRP-like cAMP-binding protein